jgi:thioredoxin-related protein/YHS domain-containing protein
MHPVGQFRIIGLNRKAMNTPLLNYHRLGLFSALTAIVSVCLLAVSGLAQGVSDSLASPVVRWETDLNAATARAEREQRPLFLHFVGNDASTTQQMEKEVFVQPNIASHLNANFVMVKINASENPALAQKFAVTEIPTDLIMQANGQPIHRRRGVITADRFAQYLAFLQETIGSGIQSGKNQASTAALAAVPASSAAGSFPVTQPSGLSNPPSTPPPAATVPGVVTPQPQRETGHVANPVPDPFASLSTPHPSALPPSAAAAAAMSPSPGTNPLRTAETAARPTVEQVANSPYSPQTILNETAPPATAATVPSVAAMLAAEPAPAKMMIEVPLALEGFCPVTLCIEERWVSGNPAYSAMYLGHIFRFATMEAMATFARNPMNYIPVAMGEDIVLMADRNKRVNGNRKFGACFQGRVFLFSSQETFNAFEARPDYYTEIALKYETARREQQVPVVY